MPFPMPLMIPPITFSLGERAFKLLQSKNIHISSVGSGGSVYTKKIFLLRGIASVNAAIDRAAVPSNERSAENEL